MDLVAHCGGRMGGPFLWTLVLTDVASGWSECVPMPSRDGLLVRSPLQELQTLMPLPLRGIDVDNDTTFMNEDLERWSAEAAKPVEPVFGQIKGARGHDRFRLRGLEKVNGEWALIATTHNLLRLLRATVAMA